MQVKQLIQVRSTRTAGCPERSHSHRRNSSVSVSAPNQEPSVAPSAQITKSTLFSLGLPSSLPATLLHAVQPGGANCLSSAGQKARCLETPYAS